jgi:hypothetical protein
LISYAEAQQEHSLADPETYPEEQAAIMQDGSLLIFITLSDGLRDESPRLIVPPSAWMLEGSAS